MDPATAAHNFYVPAFSIQVGGDDLLKKGFEIFSVSVNNTLEGASDFSFTVNNPIDREKKDFRYLSEPLFKAAFDDLKQRDKTQIAVTIKMGYGDRGGLKPVFSGIITAMDVSFPANGASQLTVKGYDRSHLMMKGQPSQSWGSEKSPVTYSDIVKRIAAKPEYGFDQSHKYIFETHEKYNQVKQGQGQSDFDFIQKKLADEIGFETFVRDRYLYFQPRQNDRTDSNVELIWGRTLISFSPKLNTAKQVTEVQVRGWDPAKQKPIVGKAKSGGEHGRDAKGRTGGQAVAASQGDVVKHVSRPVKNQKEADDIAKSILEKTSLGYVTGNGESLGMPEIVAGENIKLSGLGGTFSKVYYIKKVGHTISTSGYKTTFEVSENSLNG